MSSPSTSKLLSLLTLFFWRVHASPANSPRSLPSHARAEFVCPEEDIVSTLCLGPKDCLYPNPTSCNTFIQCTVNPDGVTGTPVVMPCPAGLEWNDSRKECDWPANSTCKNIAQEVVDDAKAVLPPAGGVAVTDGSFDCVVKEESGACDGTKGVGLNCNFEDPADECGGYIQCVVGVPYRVACSAGDVYDSDARACVVAHDGLCGGD